MNNNTNKPTRGLFRLASAAIGFGAITSLGLAGEIEGTVVDHFGQGSLSSAKVTLVETGTTTTTDAGGKFRFLNLPAGNYTISARYIGYETASSTIQVSEIGLETISIELNGDVVELEGLVVEGIRDSRYKSLQQKLSQTNISDLVSADSIGNLPDRNVAEGVARLPGVSLSLDQGEGRYVSIRGAEPGLNQVMMDGATMAAPGGRRLGRAVPLDTLSAGQISQIEVIKSVTPDLDANAVGGTINIKSASAFNRDSRFVNGSVALNLNEAQGDLDPEFQVTYGDRFGTDRNFAVAVSLSHDERSYENQWIQAAWRTFDYEGETIYLPSDFEIKPESGSHERTGASVNIEFKPNENTLFFFRPNYSTATKEEERYESIYSASVSADNVDMDSATSGSFTGGARTERRVFRITEDQELMNLALGMESTFGDFVFEPMVTYSNATEERAKFDVFQFRNSSGDTGLINFQLDSFVPDMYDVDLSNDSLSDYSLRRVRYDSGPLDETTYTAKADLRWNLSEQGYLKTGMKYINRDRSVDLDSYRLANAGGWDLSAIGSLPSVGVYGDRFDSGFLLDFDKTYDYISSNPDATVYDQNGSESNSVEDDYAIEEEILAAYVMGEFNFGNFDLLGGVRWEQTDATISAIQARSADGEFIGRIPISGSTKYDVTLPNLQGVYHFTDTVLLRGAITQTIGRPSYEDASPLSEFEYEALDSPLDPEYPNVGSLEIGNPELGPYDSVNFDLSFEWYMQGDGLLSAALFRKEIDDPIYGFSETRYNVDYNGVALESLSVSSTRNADSATVSGLELAFYKPLTFLATPFDGLGIDANLTFIDSSVEVPTRPDEDLPFFRQPDQISNVTLFYEKNNYTFRLAWNYTSDQLDSLGSNPLRDVYRNAREQYDFQASYRFSENYAISASIRNLTQEPEEYSYGIKSLMQSSRELDRDYRVSLNFNY